MGEVEFESGRGCGCESGGRREWWTSRVAGCESGRVREWEVASGRGREWWVREGWVRNRFVSDGFVMMGLGMTDLGVMGFGSGSNTKKKISKEMDDEREKMRVIMIWVMRMRVTTMRVRWMREMR